MSRLNFKTKSEIVYQKLKRGILTGKYKPQQRVIISRVAREYGTSGIPVREAIKHLESEGFIQSTPHVGAVISHFDIVDMEKIFAVRKILEGVAGRMAAARVLEEGLRSLRKNLAETGKAIGHQQYETVANLNREFHEKVYSYCENEYLEKVIFELWDRSSRSRSVFVLIPHRCRQALLEHKRILAALEQKDGRLAEKIIQEQLQSALRALKSYFCGNEKSRAASP